MHTIVNCLTHCVGVSAIYQGKPNSIHKGIHTPTHIMKDGEIILISEGGMEVEIGILGIIDSATIHK